MFNDNNNLANRIKVLREERDLSRADLAEKAGISLSAVGNYERDINVPDASTLKKIAEALGATTDYLLGVVGARRTNDDINIDDIGLSTDSIKVLVSIRKDEYNTGHSSIKGLNYLINHPDFTQLLALINLYINDHYTKILKNLEYVYHISSSSDEKEKYQVLIDQIMKNLGNEDFSIKAAELLEKMLKDTKNNQGQRSNE